MNLSGGGVLNEEMKNWGYYNNIYKDVTGRHHVLYDKERYHLHSSFIRACFLLKVIGKKGVLIKDVIRKILCILYQLFDTKINVWELTGPFVRYEGFKTYIGDVTSYKNSIMDPVLFKVYDTNFNDPLIWTIHKIINDKQSIAVTIYNTCAVLFFDIGDGNMANAVIKGVFRPTFSGVEGSSSTFLFSPLVSMYLDKNIQNDCKSLDEIEEYNNHTLHDYISWAKQGIEDSSRINILFCNMTL